MPEECSMRCSMPSESICHNASNSAWQSAPFGLGLPPSKRHDSPQQHLFPLAELGAEGVAEGPEARRGTHPGRHDGSLFFSRRFSRTTKPLGNFSVRIRHELRLYRVLGSCASPCTLSHWAR